MSNEDRNQNRLVIKIGPNNFDFWHNFNLGFSCRLGLSDKWDPDNWDSDNWDSKNWDSKNWVSDNCWSLDNFDSSRSQLSGYHC